jgi:hypothetical protein
MKYLLGFDFDGVISSFCERTFRTLHTQKDVEDYYRIQELWLNPMRFGEIERNIIISGRHQDFTSITAFWLKSHNIEIPYILLGTGEYQDWSLENRILRTQRKAQKINEYDIKVYFEDDPYTIDALITLCPNTTIIAYKHNNNSNAYQK